MTRRRHPSGQRLARAAWWSALGVGVVAAVIVVVAVRHGSGTPVRTAAGSVGTTTPGPVDSAPASPAVSTPAPVPTTTPAADPAAACTGLQSRIDRVLGADRIAFAGGSTRLEGASLGHVRQVARLLASCPAARVVVEGHTANDVPASAPSQVSLARADAVRGLLVASGVNPANVTSRSLGGSQPLTSGATGQQRNRYADIEVR